LMKADPGYMANLMALPLVERERLLGGNWKIRAAAGLLFQRGWCQIIDVIPAGTFFVRGWDFAATPKTETNDPDWTAGTKIGRTPDGRFVVAHHVRGRMRPSEVERLLVNTAQQDGFETEIALPQDPAQAGKAQAEHLIRLLAGFNVHARPISGDKVIRFSPFSAQAEAGNVLVLRGLWNDDWFTALEGFPDAAHDDDADSTAEAFNALAGDNLATWAKLAG
jgi:predicted phage terminase large subunit-like protein